MKIPLVLTYLLCSLALSAQVQKSISLANTCKIRYRATIKKLSILKRYKKIVLTIILMLVYGEQFCQTKDTVVGTLVKISNPCIDEICLPGLVYAIKNDTAVFILSVNSQWHSTENEFIFNNESFGMSSSVVIIGNISRKHDIENNLFFDLEIDALINNTSSDLMVENLEPNVFPYYNNEQLFVKYEGSLIESISILNINGKCTAALYFHKSDNVYMLEGITSKGIYTIRVVTSDKQVVTAKILVR